MSEEKTGKIYEAMEEKIGKIYEAMTAVMSEISAIEKNKINRHQEYKFRGIDDVYNALHPLFAKHKIFICPHVREHSITEGRTAKGGKSVTAIIKVGYKFYTTDGSYVTILSCGEGNDTSDKATNKAMAAAFKYAIIQAFCIPTDDIIDADSETIEHGKPEQKVTNVQKEKLTFLKQNADDADVKAFDDWILKSKTTISKMTTEQIEKWIEYFEKREGISDGD